MQTLSHVCRAGVVPICATVSRERSLLCVVESPADVVAVEQSGSYRGTYFALMGHLSPLDGIGRKNLACRNWKPFWRKAKLKK